MHPFARARERTRALNAAKLEKIFAKPFVDSLEGHVDAVEVLVKKPGSLTTIASGSWDGGVCVCSECLHLNVLKTRLSSAIILHNLSLRTQLLKLDGAHKGKVSGLCFATDDRLLSCGVDRNIKMWDTGSSVDNEAPVVRLL